MNININRLFRLCVILFFVTIMPSFGSNRNLTKIQEKILKNIKFIQFAYDHILPGESLYRIKPKIEKVNKIFKTARIKLEEKSYKNSYRFFRKARIAQSRILGYISKVYQERTQLLLDHLLREYLDVFQNMPKAKRYLKLGTEELYRANSYKRMDNPKLAIHTYRRARSYYFHALAQINKGTPTRFNLELTDLSALPAFFHPPQLKKISLKVASFPKKEAGTNKNVIIYIDPN